MTVSFTLRTCRRVATTELYALLVDQDGDTTDLSGPYDADALPELRTGDLEWIDDDEALLWADRQGWELLEAIPLENGEEPKS